MLAISVLKKLGGSTILENNIVQTIGSAGESLAAGVVFTIPALIFLLPLGPAYFNYLQITVLAIAGGILGVLMMVPLRRALIVKEHGVLPYPEGHGLRRRAGRRRAGRRAGEDGVHGPRHRRGLEGRCPGSSRSSGPRSATRSPAPASSPTPRSTSICRPNTWASGYVIGPRIAGVMFAGGVLSWLVLLPLLSYLGNFMTVPLPPVPASGLRIDQMSAGQLWSAYIRYTGAGAVLAAGLITLARTIPTIVTSFRDSVKDFGSRVRVPRPARAPSATCRSRSCSAARSLLAIFLVVAPGTPTQGNVAGRHPHRAVRLLLRDRVVAHHRPHRQLVEPDLGDDDRHADPDLHDLRRRRLDRRRLRADRARRRRRGLHRRRDRAARRRRISRPATSSARRRSPSRSASSSAS